MRTRWISFHEQNWVHSCERRGTASPYPTIGWSPWTTARVSFRWKDYRDGDRQKTMTLDGEEFLRRFLIHVLPDGFHRIRHYGFLANCHRERKLALCRKLLGMAPMEPTADPPADYRDRFEALTGCSLHECPHCRTGIMVVIGCIARATVCQPLPNTS